MGICQSSKDMSSGTSSEVVGADDDLEEAGFGYSLWRSLVTPIWTFNLYPLAYMTIGMALAAVEYGGWDWRIWGLALVTIWFGDEGVHNFDLAPEDIAIHLDQRVQWAVGLVYVAIGVAGGVALAYLTTWWFLALVGVGTFFSLAYNLEWFDGVFHDRDYITGTGNLSLNVVGIPAFGGYFLLAQTANLDLLGMAIIALGMMVNMSALDVLEQDAKAVRYQIFETPSTRDVEADVERLQGRAMQVHVHNMVSFWAIAVGLFVMFGL